MPLLAIHHEEDESAILANPLSRTHGMTDSRAPNERYNGGSKDGLFAERYGKEKVSYGLASAGAGGDGGGKGNNSGGGNNGGGGGGGGGGGWGRGNSIPSSKSSGTTSSSTSASQTSSASPARIPVESSRKYADSRSLSVIPEKGLEMINRVNSKGQKVVVIIHGSRHSNRRDVRHGNTAASKNPPAGSSDVGDEQVASPRDHAADKAPASQPREE